jgi:hypothetical protein
MLFFIYTCLSGVVMAMAKKAGEVMTMTRKTGVVMAMAKKAGEVQCLLMLLKS